MAHTRAHSPEQHDPADQWHDHHADAPPQHAHTENIPAGQVIVFGLGGFLIIVAVIVATVMYYNWYATSLEVRRVEGTPTSDNPDPIAFSKDADAKRAMMLKPGSEGYGVIDPGKGVYRLNLDAAADKVIKSYSPR